MAPWRDVVSVAPHDVEFGAVVVGFPARPVDRVIFAGARWVLLDRHGREISRVGLAGRLQVIPASARDAARDLVIEQVGAVEAERLIDAARFHAEQARAIGLAS